MLTTEWFFIPDAFYLDLSLSIPGYLVSLSYAAICIVLGSRHFQGLSGLRTRQSVLILTCLLIAPFLAFLFVIRSVSPDSILIGPVAIFELLASTIIAVWVGPFFAIVLGLLSGLTAALAYSHRIPQIFEIAIWSVSVAYLVRLPYPDKVTKWIASPIAASCISAVLIGLPAELLGVLVTDHAPILISLDHLSVTWFPTLTRWLITALSAGVAAQFGMLVWPIPDRKIAVGAEIAPWQRGIRGRVSYVFVPLSLTVLLIFAGLALASSQSLATGLIIEQMQYKAQSIGGGVPQFVQQGYSLLNNIAEDKDLLSDDARTIRNSLAGGFGNTSYFERLVLLDSDRRVIDVFPDIERANFALSPEADSDVEYALAKIPQLVPKVTFASERATLTFIVPIQSGQLDNASRVLIGQAFLEDNPALAPLRESLSGETSSGGGAFIVDDENRILISSAGSTSGSSKFDLGAAVEIAGQSVLGRAFRQAEGDGSRQLIYLLPISGQPSWSVVLTAPNEIALALAIQIAAPMLGLVLVVAVILMWLNLRTLRGVTLPLEKLAHSVEMMAEQEMESPVQTAGSDEIGRLGRAFNKMRLGLKKRLDEQELLLRVSRSVSSNLELFRAMPPILSGALDIASAVGARVAIKRGKNLPFQTYAAGEAAAGMGTLDSSLMELVEKQGTVVISRLSRASGSLDLSGLSDSIKALVALPLRGETFFHGIMWLAYDSEHVFEQSEMNFLSTLAGQAAIAIANARLFAETEEGRRKLEAVLDSTADGMIVVDNQGKIVLMNPAAGKYFDVRTEQARGRVATEIINLPELARLLTDLQEPASSLELPGHNGAILLANTSTIMGHDGAITGRVSLLRDITALKELDNIKSVFLRMVSHDLRSPLTYMRGYLSMLPLSGDLNDVQLDAVDKIESGIQHISEMTERLLYLSRLQFGDAAELELSLIDVADLLKEIESEQRGHAQDKNIKLTFQASGKLPLLLADGMLFHQAISNLVANAIKYTRDDGQIKVRAYVDGQDRLTISVADNGLGINPEDQPRVFEAFFRAPQREGEPPRPRGTGLGLALVKAIADAHNGSIRVESAYGKGSQFYLTVPIRDASDF